MRFVTFWKGMPRILLAATNIGAMRSSTEGNSVSYTKLFMRSQKKSRHYKPGDLAGQRTGLSRPIHHCPKFTCTNCGAGDRGRVAIYRPFGEFRRAKIALSPVWCSRPSTSCPCHDELRGPRSDYVRQVASENNNKLLQGE
ncbi:hypothetical protein TNCV_3274381 [Trichonephila clavipes]|nr:hypothetical protein TNCV_3274381 [Trichonephila clavipes]